jgi:nucleotide-binding universal stress UspA family protein
MKITHILVTSDLSAEALRPCKPIAALARAVGARITLLNVVEDLPVAPLGTPFEPVILAPDLSARVESARAHLEKHRDLFDGANVTVEVVTGVEAVYTIMDYAEKNDVDLIAMSTHGRTGFRRLVLGSIAEALLRRSTVPVLVFPRPNVEASVARKTA